MTQALNYLAQIQGNDSALGVRYHFGSENPQLKWAYVGQGNNNGRISHIFAIRALKNLIITREIEDNDLSLDGESLIYSRLPSTLFYHSNCPASEGEFDRLLKIIGIRAK